MNINTKRNYFHILDYYLLGSLYERWSAFTARYEMSAKTQFGLFSFFWPHLGSRFQSPACHRRRTGNDPGRFGVRLELDKLAVGQTCLLVFRLIPVSLIPRILLSSLRALFALTGTNRQKCGLPKKNIFFGNRKASEKKVLSLVLFLWG